MRLLCRLWGLINRVLPGRTLLDELSDYSSQLLSIKAKLYLLRAIHKELEPRVESKSGKVMVRNLQVYEMVLDTYNMLVIDLCSFCAHFGEEGGFIRRLNSHLSVLKPVNPKKLKVDEPNIILVLGSPISDEHKAEIRRSSKEHRKKQLGEVSREAVDSLFPGWQEKGKVTQSDVESLRGRFMSAVKNIGDDRNVYRAHRFEKASKKKASTVVPVNLNDIEQAFREVEKLLENLWLIAQLSNFQFDTDLNAATDQTAKDIVDLFVFGSVNRLVEAVGIPEALKENSSQRLYYWQFRENSDDTLPTFPAEVASE